MIEGTNQCEGECHTTNSTFGHSIRLQHCVFYYCHCMYYLTMYDITITTFLFFSYLDSLAILGGGGCICSTKLLGELVC